MNKGINRQLTKEVQVVVNVKKMSHLASNQRHVNGNYKEKSFFTSQIGNVGKRVRKWSLTHTAVGQLVRFLKYSKVSRIHFRFKNSFDT